MRYSTTTTLVAISSLAFLACSSFTNNSHNSFVSAALTPQERLETEARDPTNPNYCPDCLTKALVNHFPHACPPDLQPMVAISRPSGPTPAERRCICVAFLDLFWMKTDCSSECAFVHDADAMTHFMTAKSIPGCDKYVDFETNTELEVEGFEKKDPTHVPEVFVEATQEEAQEAEAVAAAEREKKEAEAAAEREAKEAAAAAEQLLQELKGGKNGGPELTINMDNLIHNADGGIPDYVPAELVAEAKAEMARMEAERVEAHAAKAKAKADAAAASAASAAAEEAESESKARDEL
ncbi:hypothetical protein BGX24_010778 [Mortierella sp. AD032]|nr:hypothetical protein BGX24_010778 [Mortierella sp. AD032]